MDTPIRYRIGPALLDPGRGLLTDAEGRPIALRAQSMKVLEQLAAHAGAVVSREQLQQAVWPGLVVTDDSLVQCVGDIRRALGDARHQLLRTVARRGYLLQAEALAGPPPAGGAQALSEAASAPAAERRPWPGPRLLALGAALLVAVAAAAWWWRPALEPTGTAAGAWPALAVLAFRTEPAGDDSGLGRSIAEELIGDMARNVDLPVVSGRSSFQLDTARMAVPDIARQLRVRYLVDGSVRREGDALAIRVDLVDAGTGRIVWVDQSRATVQQLAAQRAALVERIAGSVTATLRSAEKRKALEHRPAASLDAYALTLRGYAGKHQFTPQAYRAARTDLQEALRLDPQHAPAWAVLGYLNATDANNRISGDFARERLPEALAQIEHAIQLDPSLPLAHQARAVALAIGGRSAEALLAAQEAVRLAPGDADNLAVLAKAQLEAGQGPAAVATLERALALYPLVPVYVSYWEANIRWAVRDYEGALARANYCIERALRYLQCRVARAATLFELGRLDEARQEAREVQRLAPQTTPAVFLSSLGGVDEYRQRRLRAFEALVQAPDR